MFETKVINGILHSRSRLDDDFKPMSVEELTARLVKTSEEAARFADELQKVGLARELLARELMSNKRELANVQMMLDNFRMAIKKHDDWNAKAQEHCQKYCQVDAWGRFIWDVILEDAQKYRKSLEGNKNGQG